MERISTFIQYLIMTVIAGLEGAPGFDARQDIIWTNAL